MSVGSWQPPSSTAPSSFKIDHRILKDFIQLAKTQPMDNLSQQLSDDIQRQQQPLMTLKREIWQEAATDLSNHDIEHLVRFFTLAEAQLSGWEAGADSPVIWLVKVLRQRKAPPSKELLHWIKANSDNRFLPNGAL